MMPGSINAELLRALLLRILQDLQRARTGSAVAVVGAATRAAAGRRSASMTRPTAASPPWAFAC